MSGNRSRTGLWVSMIGAIVLLASALVPWYGVALTQRGARLLDTAGEQFAAEYGNAALQAKASADHGTISTLVGHQLTTLSAHQAHGVLGVLLLVLGGLALLLTVAALLPSDLGLPEVGGQAIALLGVLAGLLSLYAIAEPPAVSEGALAFSLETGPWVALAASLLLIAGGLWPRRTAQPASDKQLQDALSSLSGWTPGS